MGKTCRERTIDEQLVRRLLKDQHADLERDEIRLLGVGWDNSMYRLGAQYVVRLPRRDAAAALVEHEQTWLPILASELPLPVPSPIRVGRPTNFYPWSWSILPWIPGETADAASPDTSQSQVLSEFLVALHKTAPADAPHNPFRGVPLRKRAKAIEERLDRLRHLPGVDMATLQRVLNVALEAREMRTLSWLHGDLHARNVLVSGGRITGIIDWGDITSGDEAADLASIWMLFAEPDTRMACLESYRASDDVVARAKGWAVFFGSTLLDAGETDQPRHANLGIATLRRVSQDS